MQLLERAELLQRLKALLAEVAVGGGRLVFIGGEAGIGKSALINAFAAECAKTRVEVMIGACDLLATPRPLGCLLDIASTLDNALEESGANWASTTCVSDAI
jgi:predicted ATPase